MKTSDFIRELTLFMETNRQRLYKYACYCSGDPAVAADILQDVYLSLCENRGIHGSVRSIAPYVFRTLSNRCSRIERNKFEPIESVASILTADPDTETFAEEYRRINMLLAELPDNLAEIIRLKCFGELTFGDISESLGLPESTVKSRYYTAIERIRNRYIELSES